MEKDHNRRRRFATIFVLAVLAAATLGAWAYVAGRGGIVEVLKLPPVVDKSTPVEQQGLTLVRLERSDRDGEFDLKIGSHVIHSGPYECMAGLWIKTPHVRAIKEGDADGMYSQGWYKDETDFYVTERASTGEAFPAPWRFISKATPQYLFVPLADGYTDKLRWMDVIVADPYHHIAKWRITRLPAVHEVIPEGVKTTNQIAFRGATITARAIRAWGHGIRVELLPHIPTPPVSKSPDMSIPAETGIQWQFQHGVITCQWEPMAGAVVQDSASSWGDLISDPRYQFLFDHHPSECRYTNVYTPFAAADHYVRVSGTLTEFETYTDTVTLPHIRVTRNTTGVQCYTLPNDMPLTTPSGVKLTVLHGTYGIVSTDPTDYRVDMIISSNAWSDDQPDIFDRSTNGTWLRNSPLVMKYRRPATLQAFAYADGVPLDVGLPGWGGNSKGVAYELETPRDETLAQAKIIKRAIKRGYVDLKLKILQRVDFAKCHYTLTLPVEDPTPADRKMSHWQIYAL